MRLRAYFHACRSKIAVSIVLLAVAVTLFSFRSWAQENEYDCAHPKSQRAINYCAAQEANAAEAQVRAAYDNLIAKVGADSEAGTAIAAMETAWESYKAAFVQASYPLRPAQVHYGSMYSQRVSELRKYLAEQHLKDLEILSRRYGGES